MRCQVDADVLGQAAVDPVVLLALHPRAPATRAASQRLLLAAMQRVCQSLAQLVHLSSRASLPAPPAAQACSLAMPAPAASSSPSCPTPCSYRTHPHALLELAPGHPLDTRARQPQSSPPPAYPPPALLPSRGFFPEPRPPPPQRHGTAAIGESQPRPAGGEQRSPALCSPRRHLPRQRLRRAGQADVSSLVLTPHLQQRRHAQ
eukprot:762437-Hanusia_phi.AAC.2